MRLDGFFPKFSLGMLAQQARRAVFKQQQARRAVLKQQEARRAVFKAARAGHQSRRKLDRRIKCGDDVVQEDRTARAVSSGLTRREHGGAFCIDREQPRAFFINSKPRRGLLASQ